MPFPMETIGLRHGQAATPGEDLRCSRAGSEQLREIGLRVAGLLHADSNGLNRVGGIYRPILCFIVLDQRGEHVKTLGLQATGRGLMREVLLDLGEGPVVVGFGPQRPYIHVHHTVSGLILSYCAWMPTNLVPACRRRRRARSRSICCPPRRLSGGCPRRSRRWRQILPSHPPDRTMWTW